MCNTYSRRTETTPVTNFSETALKARYCAQMIADYQPNEHEAELVQRAFRRQSAKGYPSD